MISFCSYIEPHLIDRYVLNLHPWPIAKQFEFKLHLVNLQSCFDIFYIKVKFGVLKRLWRQLKITSITKAIMNH